MIRYLSLLMLLLFTAGSAGADSRITPVLRLPELNIRAGTPVRVKVFFYNEDNDAVEFTLPGSLSMRVQAPDGSLAVVTAVEVRTSPKALLQPKEFLTKEYIVVLPNQYTGMNAISLVGYPETDLLVNILAQGCSEEDSTTDALPKRINDDYPSLESLFSAYQPFSVNLSVYEPIYFLVGTDPSKSKFQISLKYRPFNPAGSLSRRHPWLSGLYFAYTQTSFWDLSSESAPFEDTSYKPGVFFMTDNCTSRPSWLKGLLFQGGLQHESNGKDGDSSRSTNTAYFKPIFIFYSSRFDLGLQFSPKLFTYYNNSRSTNPYLSNYRGNVEFELRFGKVSGFVSTTCLRFADKGTSFQTDLSYPISKLLKSNFDLFFHVQYTYALAESLIKYQERNQALRIGFSIAR